MHEVQLNFIFNRILDPTPTSNLYGADDLISTT